MHFLAVLTTTTYAIATTAWILFFFCLGYHAALDRVQQTLFHFPADCLKAECEVVGFYILSNIRFVMPRTPEYDIWDAIAINGIIPCAITAAVFSVANLFLAKRLHDRTASDPGPF